MWRKRMGVQGDTRRLPRPQALRTRNALEHLRVTEQRRGLSVQLFRRAKLSAQLAAAGNLRATEESCARSP